MLFSQSEHGITFGSINNDNGMSLALTTDGGYIISGTTRNLSVSSEDIYVIRINAQGQLVWSKTFGGIHQDFGRTIISVADGYILGGDTWDGGDPRTAMYMCMIDNQGNKVWDKQYGGDFDEKGFKIIQTNDGGFAFVGYSRSYDLIGNIFLVKTDAQGNEIWRNDYGFNGDDYAMGIVENEDGSFIIAGTKDGFFNDVHANFGAHDADIQLIKVDSNGQEIWKKLIGLSGHDFGYAIKKAQSGGYYIFGSTQSYGAGSFDMFLSKVDNEGNEEWHRTFGGAKYEYGVSMDINEQDELFLFGTTKSLSEDGSADMYLVKADNSGEPIWELTLGGDLSDFGNSVVATADSGCAIVGSSQSFGAGGFDVLFAKVNKNGQLEQLLNGLDTIDENQLVVAPNPVNQMGKIIVKDNNLATSLEMEVISVDGTSVRKYLLNPPEYLFNVSDLAAGIYIYKIIRHNSPDVIYRGKLIIY